MTKASMLRLSRSLRLRNYELKDFFIRIRPFIFPSRNPLPAVERFNPRGAPLSSLEGRGKEADQSAETKAQPAAGKSGGPKTAAAGKAAPGKAAKPAKGK